jgi:hypothetical protein
MVSSGSDCMAASALCRRAGIFLTQITALTLYLQMA